MYATALLGQLSSGMASGSVWRGHRDIGERGHVTCEMNPDQHSPTLFFSSGTFASPMGWLCTKFLSSVSCLILLWVSGSGKSPPSAIHAATINDMLGS